MILVVGATGLVGGEVCRILAERGDDVRALVRWTSDPDRVMALRGLGAELVEGDLKRMDTLLAACDGVDAVVSTATATTSQQEGDTIEAVDRDGQLALVDAASQAGVRRFVFISFPPFPIDSPLQSAKLAVERRLAEGEMEWVSVRAGPFHEVWLSSRLGADPLGGTLRVYGSGEQKISWISFRDVARFAAEAVGSPAARNRLLDIGGPSLSYHEVARVFEEETGHPIALEYVPVEALEAQVAAGRNSLETSFATLILNVGLHGAPIDMEPVLRDFPRERESVREYTRSLVAAAAQA
ncbi:MAG: SDR family oxidoreductase [Gaiellaceae bacterium]